MSTAKAPQHFSGAMIAIHWLTAVLIATVVVLAWVWPNGPARADSIQLWLHRSFGLTILALVALRLVLRATLPVPAETEAVSWLERAAAQLTHLLLYAIMLGMPITGFLWATSRGKPVDVFGLFSVPPLLPASETVHNLVRTVHSAGQYAVYVVVGLHVAAALFHLVVRRDGVMARMLPGAQLTRPLPPAAVRPAAR